jgi:hypothetical protein
VRAEVVQGGELEREGVRRRQDDGRSDARLERLLPAIGADAPSVARDETPNPSSGRGVERSFPTEALKARNSSVITAHTPWTPMSSPPVRQ